MRRPRFILTTALLSLWAAGCNAYRLDPPAGFAEVRHRDDGAHMKANNNVGLRVNVFANVKGGTLAFWSRDLVEKLGARGYTLTGQSPTESGNGVVGTRFDFDYSPVGRDEGERFYTAVLFVSDEHRVVLQIAGREQYRAQYSARVEEIVDELKVRGCKVASKICEGPQPERLSDPTAGSAPATNDAAPAETARRSEPDPPQSPPASAP